VGYPCGEGPAEGVAELAMYPAASYSCLRARPGSSAGALLAGVSGMMKAHSQRPRLGIFDSDDSLIARHLAGDAEAFDRLAARHRWRVYHLIRNLTGDPEWSEDIAAEAFVELYQSLPGYRACGEFRAWLHRLALNVCYEQIRKKKRRRQVDEVPLEETVPAASESPEEAAIGKDLNARVVQLVEQLPEAQKSAITLFFFDDLKCSEIAVRLGVPVNTVKTRLHYGIKALRVRLQADAALAAPSERDGIEV